jgi:hypothetical protein
MKRRSFIQKVSSASSVFLVNPKKLLAENKAKNSIPNAYPPVKSIQDILSKDQQVLLRFEIRAKSSVVPLTSRFKFEVGEGKLDRKKHYFFENDQNVKYDTESFASFQVNQAYPRIIVAWINQPKEETRVKLFLNGAEKEFTLRELIEDSQIAFEAKEIQVIANYLLDHEIAFVHPNQLGIKEPKGPFSIIVMADTQGGNPDTSPTLSTRIKIHNAFNEDTVQITNKLDPQPAFSLVLGDVVDNQGEEQHFETMHAYLKEIKSPVLYAVGNHETRYAAQFSPGYHMEEFNNYFAAQKAINGTEWLLYSFNLGKWHFVVWPDPLRDNFWETHPHYFDWLEQDLEKHKDMPVMFMQHVPSHPIGIDPLINYAESVYVKRYLMDIISKYGNVKYVFSGHVHILIRASFKTAVNYRGMNMINLPAAGYRPRAFGEEEWFGGPSQGVMVAHINDTQAEIQFKTVTEEIFTYPQDLPVFDEDAYPLWYSYKWELPAEERLRNGDFSDGLKYWSRRFVYQEDKDPSNIMEVRELDQQKALYLYSRKRGYATPGQDRLPQSINQLCQAIKLNGNPGLLSFEYTLDKDNTQFDGYSGAFILIEGFSGSFKTMNMVYWLGKPYGSLGDKATQNKMVPLLHFRLPENKDSRNKAELNLVADFESNGEKFDTLKLDRLVVNLGTWNMNDGEYYPYAVYIGNIRFGKNSNQLTNSTVNGLAITKTKEAEIWWMRNNHIAGEHKYHSPTEERKSMSSFKGV